MRISRGRSACDGEVGARNSLEIFVGVRDWKGISNGSSTCKRGQGCVGA